MTTKSLRSRINPMLDLIPLGQAPPAKSGCGSRPAMTDPLRSPWTRLALVGIFLAPLAVGFCLECRWLIQAGFIVLLVIILGSIGYEMQRWQRRQEVRENLRKILEERK